MYSHPLKTFMRWVQKKPWPGPFQQVDILNSPGNLTTTGALAIIEPASGLNRIGLILEFHPLPGGLPVCPA